MKYEKKLHVIATPDAVVLAVSAAYEKAQTALANLSSATEAADEAKRVLNDCDFWTNYQKRNSAEELAFHRRTFLTLQHSASLAFPSRLNAACAAASELEAAAKQLRAHKLPDAHRDPLIDLYHTAKQLVRHITSVILRSRLSDSSNEAKSAFDATFNHFANEKVFGWPRVHFLTPWINVPGVLAQSAKDAMDGAKKIVESNHHALRDAREFRGNVLDEESYGRRLERAKSKKQRDALIADQRARRLQLNHLRIGLERQSEQNSSITSTLVEWANELEAASVTDKEHAEALRNNCLVVIRAIVDCNDSRQWIYREINEHRFVYQSVRKFAEEEFTGEAA
ncbi:MAG TPA: hypothetical protein V6D22_25235 [Candidatus Obscuribacterales bacterium]